MKLFTDIYHCFRRLQIQNTFIDTSPITGLSPVETNILIELQASPDSSISSLAEKLLLTQSSISRAVTRLTQQKLLKLQTDQIDRRRKLLQLTDSAESLIDTIDENANSLVDGWKSHITKRQFTDLVQFLTRIADGLGAPPSQRRPQECAYRVQQRRLTRGLGLLGTGVFDTPYTALEWHVLNFVIHTPFPTSTGEISTYFSIPGTSVTTVVNKFESEGLITRHADSTDKRRISIHGTSKGKKTLRYIEHTFADRMRQIFSGTREASLHSQVTILKTFTSGHTIDIQFPLPPGVDIAEVKVLRDKNAHREHVLNLLVANNQARYSPHNIFAPDSHCIHLYEAENTLAYIQLDSKCRTLEIVAAEPQVTRNYIAIALEHYLAEHKQTEWNDLHRVWQPWQ